VNFRGGSLRIKKTGLGAEGEEKARYPNPVKCYYYYTISRSENQYFFQEISCLIWA